jgi:hypothetical protein
MKFIHGDILEIPLEYKVGYAYGQLMFFKEMILNVYDIFSEQPLSKPFNEEMFLNAKPLCNPFILLAYPKQRGEGKWVPIANVKPFFEIAPDFRTNTQSEVVAILKNGDLSENKYYYYKFEDVKHLPVWGHFSPKLINKSLTMYWMEKKGIKIEDYYTFEMSDFINVLARGTKNFIIEDNLQPIPEEIRYRAQGTPIDMHKYMKDNNLPM